VRAVGVTLQVSMVRCLFLVAGWLIGLLASWPTCWPANSRPPAVPLRCGCLYIYVPRWSNAIEQVRLSAPVTPLHRPKQRAYIRSCEPPSACKHCRICFAQPHYLVLHTRIPPSTPGRASMLTSSTQIQLHCSPTPALTPTRSMT
jgi:hypothetical protein